MPELYFRNFFKVLLGNSSSDFFDGLLGVSFGEDDDGVELGVVQLVDGVGRDVQEGVFASVHHLPDGGESNDAGLGSAGIFSGCCRDAFARIKL